MFTGNVGKDSWYKKALVIIGLLYSKHPSKPGLDVAKLLSTLIENVEILYCPAFSFKSASLSARRWLSRELFILKKIAKANGKFEILFIHQMIAVFGSFIARKMGTKVVVYVGGSIYEGLHQKSLDKRMVALIQALLWRLQLRLADFILIPDKEVLISSKLSSYAHKLEIAPTRTIVFSSIEETMHDKKISVRENIVGYVGRFESEKGVDKLPEIIKFSLKLKGHDNLRWILVGDGTLKPFVEDQIKESGLEDRVQFTGWIKDIEMVLFKLKLLVLPSRTEGLPNVILEAMSCRTPVLAAPVGGIPNVIKDGENGFLLESDNSQYIAEKIVELLNKPELLEKVSRNAHGWVRENFTEEKTLESWRRILQRLETL